MKYTCLSYEVKDRMAIVTLNRPEKLNALTLVFWKEIHQALKAGDHDNNVEVHLITGNGRAFCTGDDISVLTKLQNQDDIDELFLGGVYELVNLIVHLKKPLITAVNGLAYGGGCELVLLSDLAIASKEAIFALSEGRIGAFATIFSVFGPPILGLKFSNELTLLGESISAARALEIGLVNCVVPHEKLMDSTFMYARQIMKSSPVAQRIIKETSSRLLGNYLHDFWIGCQRFSREITKTDDFLEGTAAFMEKRPPYFDRR